MVSPCSGAPSSEKGACRMILVSFNFKFTCFSRIIVVNTLNYLTLMLLWLWIIIICVLEACDKGKSNVYSFTHVKRRFSQLLYITIKFLFELYFHLIFQNYQGDRCCRDENYYVAATLKVFCYYQWHWYAT